MRPRDTQEIKITVENITIIIIVIIILYSKVAFGTQSHKKWYKNFKDIPTGPS